MVNENINEKMEDFYFDLQAEIGTTKHIGGTDCTPARGKASEERWFYSVIKNTEVCFLTGFETFKAISWFFLADFIFL